MVKKILFVFLLLSVFRGNSVIGQSVIDSLRIEMSKLGDADRVMRTLIMKRKPRYV